MKWFFYAITLATISGGHLQASSVIDCSGNAAAINSCYAGKLPNFTTQLDWAVFGTPNAAVYNGVWTAQNVLTSGLDISVSGKDINPANEGLRLAYNLGTVLHTDGEWIAASLVGAGFTTSGHFNQTANPAAPLADILADPAIHLMGLRLNGVSSNPQMLLDFSSGITNFGFFASSLHNSAFDLRVQVFDGAGGTGNMLANTLFSYGVGGGVCASLSNAGVTGPTGCNDAPFIYGSGFGNGARSALISTNDNQGFYVTNLLVADGSPAPVPEPGPFVLCGCGVALLLYGNRRWRRSS